MKRIKGENNSPEKGKNMESKKGRKEEREKRRVVKKNYSNNSPKMFLKNLENPQRIFYSDFPLL
jgi:hypothetical protein